MNFYPEELDSISSLCRLLNDWVKTQSGHGVYFGKSITLYSLDGGDELGRLTDEVGGAFSFTPVSPQTPDSAE